MAFIWESAVPSSVCSADLDLFVNAQVRVPRTSTVFSMMLVILYKPRRRPVWTLLFDI